MARTDDFFVGHVKHFPTGLWPDVPSSIKITLSSGRTCPGVGSIATQAQVDELLVAYGTAWQRSRRFSISQQLDLIATAILVADRRANVGTAHSERKDWHSPWQALSRSKREIPFPNIEAIIALRRDPSKRVKNYAERVVDIPWNKTGDHNNVWSQQPKKVEKWT